MSCQNKVNRHSIINMVHPRSSVRLKDFRVLWSLSFTVNTPRPTVNSRVGGDGPSTFGSAYI